MSLQGPRNTLIAVGRRVLGSRQLNHLVRFEPVLELIGARAGSGGTLLDVGSGSLGITSLMPHGWETTTLDANFDDYGAARRGALRPHQVLGDVRQLPFEDGAFDVVVAIDLLEHLAPCDRAQAIGEICRVARSKAVIACPAGADALEADRRLAADLRTRGRTVPEWLEEHLANGFPEPADLIATAAPFGAVRLFGNENIGAHERLVAAEQSLGPAAALRLACGPLEHLMTSRRHGARRLASRLLARARERDRPPTYRAVIAVDRLAHSSG
jgi:hypothetical protein